MDGKWYREVFLENFKHLEVQVGKWRVNLGDVSRKVGSKYENTLYERQKGSYFLKKDFIHVYNVF